MATTAMVSVDIERGSELVAALERAKLKLAAGLWVVLPEYGDWRVVVASRQLDALGLRGGYLFLQESLGAAGFTPRNTPPVMILAMDDPFIRGLRRIFGKAKSVEGMRLGGQTIGDRFVEDAYVYRIA